MRRKTLIVMVKDPRPGRVKTRLAADIGTVPAVWWYRRQVRDLLRRLRDPRWRIVLAVSPDGPGMTSRAWPGDLERVTQGRGDLGARMRRLLAAAPARSCLIGSDIPQVSPGHIARAFAALGRADLVFGPTPDGGFWLVGAGLVPAGLFDGARWSTEHALADTLASVADRRVALVDTLADVDRAADLT